MFAIPDLLDRIKIIVLWAFSFYGVQSNQMSDRYNSDRKSSESPRHCRSPPRSESDTLITFHTKTSTFNPRCPLHVNILIHKYSYQSMNITEKMLHVHQRNQVLTRFVIFADIDCAMVHDVSVWSNQGL